MCIKKMKMLFRTGTLLLFLGMVPGLLGQELKKGAFILVSQKGEVGFIQQSGEEAPRVGLGQPIPPSYTIFTGSDGELVGLLSNGTLLTLSADTRMKVKTFDQEPFDDGGRKLSDLAGEPSKSKVEIDLDIGSLVVKTKKLNKGSVFDINSPVGVAGIRGTEFQMESMPGQGVQLDVTESTVAFTPPGGGNSIPVSQGSGLTVPTNGVPQMRPVNPVTAQKIESSNQAATEATQNVSLGEVTAAMEQVENESDAGTEEQSTDESAEESTEESADEPQEEESVQEDTEGSEETESVEEVESVEETESSDDADTEVQKKEDAEEQPASEEMVAESENSDTSSDTAEGFSKADEESSTVETKEENTQVSQDTSTSSGAEAESGSAEQSAGSQGGGNQGGAQEVESPVVAEVVPEKKSASPAPEPKQATPAPEPKKAAVLTPAKQQNAPSQDTAQLLENNPEFKRRQEVAKFGMDESQVEQYSTLSPAFQDRVKSEDPAVVNRLFNESEFQASRVENFYGYSKETRELMLGLDDSYMFGLLDEDFSDLVLSEALSINLSRGQVERYDQLERGAQLEIGAENSAVVTRLFGETNFNPGRVENFYGYSKDTRELMLGLDDEIFFTLLDEQFDEELLNESLTKMNIDFSNPSNLPPSEPEGPFAERLRTLSDRLKESGNGWVMDELLEMSGGELTEEWIRVGEVAEVLLRHSLVDELNPADAFQTSEVLSNPFYTDISSMFDELKLDQLVKGDGVIIGASHLIVPHNSLALNPYFGDGVSEVIISASESLSFEGDISWDVPTGTEDARLVVMSAGELNIMEGSTLESATSDLILSTREDLVLNQVNLNAAREVVIRGMRDVILNNVHIGAGNLAKIKARRNLDANGLTFRQDIGKIVMEATTLRLKNIDFPGSAQVRLNSLKGGIDGRYPNFGNVSAGQQIGRVNFIENVKSGGNILNNRAAFDQHGKNIQIGKIANP